MLLVDGGRFKTKNPLNDVNDDAKKAAYMLRAVCFKPIQARLAYRQQAQKMRLWIIKLQRRFGFIDQFGKTGSFVQRQIRQDLAVDVDIGAVQAVHQLAVGNAI